MAILFSLGPPAATHCRFCAVSWRSEWIFPKANADCPPTTKGQTLFLRLYMYTHQRRTLYETTRWLHCKLRSETYKTRHGSETKKVPFHAGYK